MVQGLDPTTISSPGITLQPSSRSALRCAYCHSPFTHTRPRACQACSALWHPECRSFLEKCPSLGCPAPVIAPPHRPFESLRFLVFWPLFLTSLGLCFAFGFLAFCGTLTSLGALLSPNESHLLFAIAAFAIGTSGLLGSATFLRRLFEWL